MIKLCRSKDSDEILPNHIFIAEITISVPKRKCKYQEIQRKHVREINKDVRYNHFLKPNKIPLHHLPLCHQFS